MPPLLDTLLWHVKPLGELTVVLPIAALLGLCCLASGDRRGALAVPLAALATAALVAAGKVVATLALGPWRPQWETISNLFPSGHVALAIVVYGAGVLVLARVAPPLGRSVIVAAALAAALLAAAIGVERVAHGAHPPLDVVGGLVVGLAMFGILARCWPAYPLSRRGGALFGGLAVAVAAGLYRVVMPTHLWVAEIAAAIKRAF